MTTIRKWIASLLAAVLCVSLLVMTAGAYERVDVSRKTSLTLSYVDSERSFPISNMNLRLYKVAGMSDAVRFTVTEDFKDASVFQDGSFSLDDMDAEKWAALANTLAAFVASDRDAATPDSPAITPAASGATDTKGAVKFENLQVGLYLVVGDRLADGRYTYTPTPFLLTLPTLDTARDTWLYDVTAENKFGRDYDPPSASYVSRNVVKVWEDDEDAEEDRPSEVTVQLLRDGKEYDTVTLNESNNWKHSWTRLNARYDWQLVELDVPENYTVLVEQTGNTFVVTNTHTEEIPDDDPPLDPTPSETPDPGTTPDPGENVDIPDEDPPQGGLPQTGVLWWPVQVLTICGIALFGIGWLEVRREKKHRDET